MIWLVYSLFVTVKFCQDSNAGKRSHLLILYLSARFSQSSLCETPAVLLESVQHFKKKSSIVCFGDELMNEFMSYGLDSAGIGKMALVLKRRTVPYL